MSGLGERNRTIVEVDDCYCIRDLIETMMTLPKPDQNLSSPNCSKSYHSWTPFCEQKINEIRCGPEEAGTGLYYGLIHHY